MKNEKGVGSIEFIVGTVIVLIIVLSLVLPLIGLHRVTGHGTHVGYVTAVETNGAIFPTDRAYLKTDTQSSQENSYCVVDADVLSQLRAASEAKSKVEVSYFTWLSSGVTSCDGEDAVIGSVRVLQ